jgi:hypothetical protein
MKCESALVEDHLISKLRGELQFRIAREEARDIGSAVL